MEWEKIFTNSTSNSGLISKINKELKKLDIRKPNNSIEMSRDLNRKFSTEKWLRNDQRKTNEKKKERKEERKKERRKGRKEGRKERRKEEIIRGIIKILSNQGNANQQL